VRFPEFLQTTILLVQDLLVVAWWVSPAPGQSEELDWFANCVLKLAVFANVCLHANEFVLDGNLVAATESTASHSVELNIRGQQFRDCFSARQTRNERLASAAVVWVSARKTMLAPIHQRQGKEQHRD
jgi:hypothetical protein